MSESIRTLFSALAMPVAALGTLGAMHAEARTEEPRDLKPLTPRPLSPGAPA